jgi:outer membrane protein, heavy metal efflux system
MHIAAGTALLVAMVCAARAQAPLSLDAAIEHARRVHPLLQASPGRVAAAESDIVQSRLRANPRLFIQTENWRGWSRPFSPVNEVDTFVYLSQSFETGGKRGGRTAVAEAGLRRAVLERELLERQIVGAVKQAYWAAAAAERIHDAALSNVANFRAVVEYHENRVREGAMAEADLIKVRLEHERLQLAANHAEFDATRSRIDLFRAMGRTEFPLARFSEPLEGVLLAPTADAERALADRVEIKIAREAREAAVAAAGLQRALARPDVEVLAGYKQTNGNPTVIGGVQWNIPLLNRNQGNIGSADAAVRVAEAEIAAQTAIVRVEVAAAAAAVEIRRRQAGTTLPRLREQAGESARIALAAYREGGADLLRLLDAERVRIEIDTLYYRTLGEYRQSIAALETALGVNR